MPNVASKYFSGLVQDEDAQSTVEYILLLSAVVSFFLIISNLLIKPVMQKASQILSGLITNTLSGANLHNFKIGK